jgi:hypothetical protein
MEPIQLAAYQYLTSRNVDESEIQHRVELRFAHRQERRGRRQQQRHQLVQWLNRWRRDQPAAVGLAPVTAERRLAD